MDIQYDDSEKIISLEKINTGSVFKLYSNLYIKGCRDVRDKESICTNIETGAVEYFGPNTQVKPVKAKVVVEDG